MALDRLPHASQIRAHQHLSLLSHHDLLPMITLVEERKMSEPRVEKEERSVTTNVTQDEHERLVQPSKSQNHVANFATGFSFAAQAIIAVCAIIMVGELATLVSFAYTDPEQAAPSAPTQIIIGGGGTPNVGGQPTSPTEPVDPNVPDSLPPLINRGTNVCAGKRIDIPNAQCIVAEIEAVGPQAGANVTAGYQGDMEVPYQPLTDPYYTKGLCPVNVHWHLGAEHLSVGEFDLNGTGPTVGADTLDGGIRQGNLCHHYNETDVKFTKPYDWKHCVLMEVGQTYEVHWPHSSAGACGTPNQFQTPFYDGVFCNLDAETLGTLSPQDIANNVGVQAQVFTVVNDETYYWPDLLRGMIVDGEMGMDVAKYTGSTTGDSRSNEICSSYTPITWQVDRKCHLVSASTFDQLCYDMKKQRDDMSGDLFPHGSRETVSDNLAPNNYNRFLRG
mmetsp:Transcript_22934/g.33992  ORF Transcript_22934/g.33992 Transcript_22934/m.33992 type:complete len:446 (-) Transcript_22934:314-1651(-)